MKYAILIFLMVAFIGTDMNAQQYKIITSVESIVPMGIGRSRIIEPTEQQKAEDFTTERTDGKKSKQSDVKRKALKIDAFKETKLLNFYSMAGINFQNIASNDAIISDRLTAMAEDGWELVFVTSGVESDGGETDANGIYITRFVFKKDE
jgi:hypothetical protein